MRKDVLIGIIILVVLIAGVIIYFGVKSNGDKVENTVQNTQPSALDIIDQQLHLNNDDENVLNEQEENVNEITNTETLQGDVKTLEDKAIEIARKDWNNQVSDVTFSIDGIEGDGLYVVSVREADTTRALAFYTVNTNDSSFTVRELY